VDLNRIIQEAQRAKVTVRCARNLGIASKEARVRTECAAHAVKPAIPRANAIHDAKHAAAQTIETLRASNVLSTSARNAKERWIQKGTIRIMARKY
jgi:rRNA-processing protein FCF1